MPTNIPARETDTNADEIRVRRNRMVDRQIAARGIRDGRVLDAMRRVPRDAFVPAGLREFAYDDTPLPIGEGQTISQPYIVALMAEAAEIGLDDCVLDVGTGSGYAAAVVGAIAREVHTIERHGSLCTAAEKRFAQLGIRNIVVHCGDGTKGWPEAAPFGAILVAAGAPDVPAPLRGQLAIGGRLVIPIGNGWEQMLLKVRRTAEDWFEEEDLGPVAFVPLIGAQGWPETTG